MFVNCCKITCGTAEVMKQEIKTHSLDNGIRTIRRKLKGGDKLKSSLEYPSKKVTDDLFKMSKEAIGLLPVTITEDCQLNKHLQHTMGIAEKSKYRSCGVEDEASIHILCHCEIQ